MNQLVIGWLFLCSYLNAVFILKPSGGMTKAETNLSESVRARLGAPFADTEAQSAGPVGAGEWLARAGEGFRGEVSLSLRSCSEDFGKFCGKAGRGVQWGQAPRDRGAGDCCWEPWKESWEKATWRQDEKADPGRLPGTWPRVDRQEVRNRVGASAPPN